MTQDRPLLPGWGGEVLSASFERQLTELPEFLLAPGDEAFSVYPRSGLYLSRLFV
jgi:hypothetical protein